MMRSLIRCFCGLMVVAVITAATPSTARADSLHISGGGTATFDDFEGGTVFTVQMQIDSDGNVSGHFYCGIPGVVAVIGDDLLTARCNDDGTVTVFGVAHGWDVSIGVFENLPFEVRLRRGGPGVGGFIYDDPVVPLGHPNPEIVNTDLQGDKETVATGHIMFRVK